MLLYLKWYNGCMFEYIERLRQKSEKQKKLIALTYAGIFSGVILGLWFISVFPTISEDKQIADREKKIKSGPSESFTSNFSGVWSDIKENFGGLKDTFAEFNNSMDYYKASSTASLITGENSISTTTEEEKQNIEISTTTQEKVYGGM